MRVSEPTDLSSIVKAYDVRGVVPDDWDADVARAIGAAFADVVATPGGATQIVIGHDMRESSPELATAFGEGAAWRGIAVVHIGLCSTDGLYHASGALNLPGAMFTASHNPSQYNGIKMCHALARPVGQDTGLADVQRLAEQYLDEGIPAGGETGETTTRDTLTDYARFLRGLVDISGGRPLKVAIDAGNGMAGHTAPAVLSTAAGLEDLGLEIIPMYFELDGTFPHHEANPLDPANLIDLEATVVAEAADIGLAFDGDADRCFVVDERGVPMSPSAITALVGLREIEKEKSAGRDATVIHNLITSRSVPDLLGAAGARTVRTRVGHSFIKAQMAQEDAVFGGEHSAHFYFRDFWFADTGMLAALHVLRALRDSDVPLSALSEMYTPYSASGEINSRVEDPDAARQRVLDAFADDISSGEVLVDELDGLTLDHWHSTPKWWLNLRSSNTEPLLRLNVEAEDEDIMEKLREAVLAIVREGTA
ncbi:phosphomannomutase/phosphoglucomutase [Pseudactinotalea terrae]|uniref:phosphomannomutase/phosphoglucomutase n=1 Tax=Pseudactinotalea terrae TaxID=1743262 RepID=UPI0012E207AB|nr:phosphomannomutase/phosphoglucomutase [Pseudactinotalea terrae]